MPVGAILGAVGGVASAIGSKRAADAQSDAANRSMDIEQQIYNQTRSDLKPWMKSGRIAQKALQYELGLGRAPMIGAKPLNIREVQRPLKGQGQQASGAGGLGWGGVQSNGNALAQPQTRTQYIVGGKKFWNEDKARQFARENGRQGRRYEGFQGSRDFKVGFQGGVDALQGSAAGQNMLLSGRTAQALTKFGTDYTMGYRDQYLNRLASMAGGGMAAAGARGTAGANFAAGAGNALAGLGNAQSAGAVGMGNALNDALGNISGSWQYQKNLDAGLTPDGWTK